MNPIKKIRITLASVSLLLFTGCNSDIFLSEPPLTDDVLKATIDGDGGVAEFNIPEEALEFISLNQVSSLEAYCTYYNAKGEVVDRKSPASKISKIVFESDFYKFEVEKGKGHITVTSISNASGYDALRTVVLQYPYGYRYIDVNMRPGKDMTLVKTVYSDSVDIVERIFTRPRQHFININLYDKVDTIMPYEDEVASLFVDPDRANMWVCNRAYTIDVPIYNNGVWEIQSMPEIKPGFSYNYAGPDQSIIHEIDLPLKSVTTIAVELTISQYNGHGQLIFLNEILDRTVEVPFDVISVYPIGYGVRYDEIQRW